jgi:hypothetical protein
MGLDPANRKEALEKLFERSPGLALLDEGEVDVWFDRVLSESCKLEDRLLAAQALSARAGFYRGQLPGWTAEADRLQRAHKAALDLLKARDVQRHRFGELLLAVWRGDPELKLPWGELVRRWDEMVRTVGHKETVRQIRNRPVRLGLLLGRSGPGVGRLRPFADSIHRKARAAVGAVLQRSHTYEQACLRAPHDDEFRSLASAMHGAIKAKEAAIAFLDRFERSGVSALLDGLIRKSAEDWRLRAEKDPISAWKLAWRNQQTQGGLAEYRHRDLWAAEAARIARRILKDEELSSLVAAEAIRDDVALSARNADPVRAAPEEEGAAARGGRDSRDGREGGEGDAAGSGGNVVRFPGPRRR